MSRNLQLVMVALRVTVRRPGLATEAIRFAFATARTDWFRRPPFLPLPDPAYLEWRLATAYGDSDSPVTVGELEEFLRWRRAIRLA